MPTTCTKCNINWERLWDQEDHDGEEVYEFCPICKTDTHLVAGKEDKPSYIRCGLTGRVMDAKTGEVIEVKDVRPAKKGRKKRRHKIWLETEEQFYERQQAEQDEWMSKYHHYLETMPAEMASARAAEGRQKVERKFVWSDEIEQSDLKTI